MTTQLSSTSFSNGIKETIAIAFNQTRTKIISAADVWNIQRQKRSRVQRRVAL